MHAAEERVKQIQTDAYEAKTKHEKYQRQQKREHEDTERRLTNELRQATQDYRPATVPDTELRQELQQAEQYARAEKE